MRTSRGFTLIEALISLTLFSVISFALVTLYLGSSRSYQEESKRTALTTTLTTFNDQLAADAQSAFTIEPTYGSYTSGAGTVILGVPGVNASGALLSSGGGFVQDRIIYTLVGSEVLKSVVPGPGSARPSSTNKVVASHVSSFVITYNQPTPATSDRLSWTTNVADTYQDRAITVEVTRSAKLRNKS
jgi:prepilin-type N-terminal cleavage/methylation domain-containing protein